MRAWENFRYRATFYHLLVSLAIAACTAWLVFQLWYPLPYRHLTAGTTLFLTIVFVDLVCGPIFTLILANPKKSKRELLLDLSLVIIIQLAALGYGLYSVKLARPAVASFERDRIAIITETEIDRGDLPNAPEGLQKLPLNNILKVGIRRAQNEKEFFESINLSFDGIEPSLRPSWWLRYEDVLPEIKEKMMPVSQIDMTQLSEARSKILNQAIIKTGLPAEELFYLPLVSKYTQEWTILLNREADFIGYANLNGFEIKRLE
ncbi:MAG: fimb protein [Eikenella sp.]|nr:fimb protein [Eikenella sp.]